MGGSHQLKALEAPLASPPIPKEGILPSALTCNIEVLPEVPSLVACQASVEILNLPASTIM